MNFYDRMRIVCMAIPEGKVATYGQIAMLCGKPRHSRQVGYGLKHDLAGADVPAHRVVNGKGELSGAVHFLIPDMQQTLLREEGIEVLWSGAIWRVDLKKYGWESTPADAADFQRQFAAAEADENVPEI